VRAAGRRAFLAIEALFNAAFGDRLNPFYRLGEIAFYLFWIVAASGLYLYAFFKTGVQEAHGSVQALHDVQPWAGGILRSVHRYASDALVVTMLLHLLRHLCFDRYRGYRWFSWISGIAVLWLVYIAGINGFMLPWDRLAQFVVAGTAEWLDALPVFSGRLVRNFIVDAAVSDRLFSLLSFLHIGVPLVLLLVLWIHIQRVPRARTVPPWPIAIPFAFSLIVLSLLRPILGSAPAQLASLPARLDMDWFYLATFPIMYATSVNAAWAMLLAGTLLLAALPWLPPRREGAGWRVVFHPGGRDILVRGGETLLDAGLREGLPLQYECRSGGCGVCKAHVIAGVVEAGAYQPAALPASERALGAVLTCCARPASDAEIEFEPAPGGAIRRLRATVASMEQVAPEVMRLRLVLPPGERLPFQAGQYFNVVLEDGARRAFSFATAPGLSDDIEMHVRRIAGGRFTTRVFTTLRAGDTLDIEGPGGQRAADHLRGRRDRVRSGEEHDRTRIPGGLGATDVSLLGCAASRRSLSARSSGRVGTRPRELQLRTGAFRGRTGGRLGRSARAGARGGPAGFPGPHRVRDLRLRVDEDGGDGAARFRGARSGGRGVLRGCVQRFGPGHGQRAILNPR
jgi:CDP-4-dehydro-6-deoxyglucose reductase, E3